MATKDIVVIGASAGGMGALERLVAGLPADLPAAVFVVWHLAPGVRSVLPTMLSRAGRLPAPEPVIAAAEREKMEAEVKIAREVDSRVENILQFGELSPFTCPECHGVLSMFRDGRIIRFRCHTGHALSCGTLLESASEQVEQRLMDALRALDETIMLLNSLGEGYAKRGDTAAADQCFNRAREAFERSRPLREAALANEELSPEDLRAARA